METPWHEPILFFPGEDPEELKLRFVEVWARHPKRTPYEIAQHVFKDLKDPVLRAGKAAEVWGIELDVLERVEKLRAMPNVPTPTKAEAVNRGWTIATDPNVDPKDQVGALRFIAEAEGWIKKDGGKSGGDAISGDLLTALAEKLPN